MESTRFLTWGFLGFSLKHRLGGTFNWLLRVPSGSSMGGESEGAEHRCVDAVLYTCGVSNAVPPHTAEQAVFHVPFQAIAAFYFCF